jgi:lipopolysaccharide/colanic/teichoic acid biosynthesis glycosyltransferase
VFISRAEADRNRSVAPVHQRRNELAVTKRFFDIVASLFGLVLLSPVLLAISVAVKLQDGGPVLYLGRRVGKDGRIFFLYKFRSMVLGADGMGAGITVGGDPRITRVGQFLRKTKLDELPQLINVLKGDMSFVGPRPEDPRYVRFYTQEQRSVLACRPGITSPASLTYRSEEELLRGDTSLERYRQEILPHKLSIELEYLKTRTLWSDIKLILHTIGRLRPDDQARVFHHPPLF